MITDSDGLTSDSLMLSEETPRSSDSIIHLLSKERTELWILNRDGRRFILKSLKAEYRNHPEEQMRLRKEYNLGMRISHAGVALTSGYEEFPEIGRAIVMEYIDGRTLADYIHDTVFESSSLPERQRIASGIASALAYIHSLGIAHRDLKPDNILLTRNGNMPKIIDFGHADSDDFTVYKKSLATREFGAPEQQAPAVGGMAADIFAFGKILSLLLPERRFKTLARKCTDQNPDLRPDMQEVADSLDIRHTSARRKKLLFILWFVGILTIVPAVFMIFNRKDSSEIKEIHDIRSPEATEETDRPTYREDHNPAREESRHQTDSRVNALEPAKSNNPEAITGERNAADSVIEKHIKKAEATISKYGRLGYEPDMMEKNIPRREKRTAATFAIADDAERELRNLGVPEAKISELLNSYWQRVVNLVNRADGADSVLRARSKANLQENRMD